MVREMWRVLEVGGRAVILLKSRSLFERVLKSMAEKAPWDSNRRWVNNGGLECHIYILTKKEPSLATKEEGNTLSVTEKTEGEG